MLVYHTLQNHGNDFKDLPQVLSFINVIIDPINYLNYAHDMLRRIFLVLLPILTFLPLVSKENVLIITTSEMSYDKYYKLIENNKENISYEIELIRVTDNFQDNEFNGSKNYLNNEILIPPLFSFYINETNNKPSISGFSTKYLPPIKITKILLKDLNLEQNISSKFPLFLINMIKPPQIQNLYMEFNIPVIILSGTIKSETILKTLQTNLTQETINSHYFLFNLLEKVYYINELFILKFAIVFTFIVIFIVQIYSKRSKFHLKHNIKYLPTILLKITMIFIFYFISSLVLEFVVTLSGIENFFLHYPKIFFSIKHLILFFIYGISFHIIKDSSFSKSPYFYIIVSFYLSLILYFVSTFFFMPLGIYFTWQIFISILFLTTKNIEFHRFLVFINPLAILLFFYNFLSKDFSYFTNFFLDSSYLGNFILTILISPFIFLQESLFRFTHRKQIKIAHTSDIIKSLLTLTVTITLVAIILELK